MPMTRFVAAAFWLFYGVVNFMDWNRPGEDPAQVWRVAQKKVQSPSLQH